MYIAVRLPKVELVQSMLTVVTSAQGSLSQKQHHHCSFDEIISPVHTYTSTTTSTKKSQLFKVFFKKHSEDMRKNFPHDLLTKWNFGEMWTWFFTSTKNVDFFLFFRIFLFSLFFCKEIFENTSNASYLFKKIVNLENYLVK